jgi:DNA-binding transcriptional LysR family regulator
MPSQLAKQAEQGAIDLAFHTTEDAPPGLRRRALFTERYVLVGRTGHPLLRKRPTLAQFCELDHVIVSRDGGGFQGVTDQALSQLGMTRRVVLSLPHFLFVPSVVESTDMVAMLPARLVRDTHALTMVEPPLEVPGYEMSMLWPERCHRDPGHQWLREFIVSAL